MLMNIQISRVHVNVYCRMSFVVKPLFCQIPTVPDTLLDPRDNQEQSSSRLCRLYISIFIYYIIVGRTKFCLVVSLVWLCCCCVVYFGFVFSLCCQSFSGSVTVTMTGCTQTAKAVNIGNSTVNNNSQTHISSEQQLPVPTPLHYPCKICGK